VPGKFLSEVFGQSEHIHELITQSAAELSSITTDITRELANSDPPPGVAIALEKGAAIMHKLLDTSERLAAVNQALLIEIRDRTMTR
jgi:hypothetical protein